MSAPDSQRDGGEQWRGDLPDSWDDCMPHPPLAPGITEDVEVIDQGEATVFKTEGSAKRWIAARNEDILSRRESR